MIINKYKAQIIGMYILISLTFSYKGFCQTHSIIDIDKVEVLKLHNKQKCAPVSDSLLSFNDIIKVKNRRKTSYMVDYIPNYQFPIIYEGNIFINLDKNKVVYDIETVTEIPNINKLHYFQCAVNKFSIKEYTKNDLYKSMFGEHPSKTVRYLASVDMITGDTLWKKRGRYLTVCQANTVSFIKNEAKELFIIDNKSGQKLFKLNSSNLITVLEIKEDNGYLYLRKSDEIIAIDLQEGEVIWRVKGNFNKFFIDETRIYLSNQCAIDKKTGKLTWYNNSDIWIVGIVGNYLIGYLYGEDDPEIFAYNKNTGKLAGYLWMDGKFCTSCFGYASCNPEFIFAEESEGNKTAALIKCNDGVYLCTFETVKK